MNQLLYKATLLASIIIIVASNQNSDTCSDKNPTGCSIWKAREESWEQGRWLTLICKRDFIKKTCQKSCNLCTDGGNGGSGNGGNSGNGGGSTGGNGGDGKSSANKPNSVSECNDQNKDHCECGDTTQGFTTYVFQIAGVTRCFTVYRPQNRLNEKLPVVITSQCYGKDRLAPIGMQSNRQIVNQVAKRYGFARIGLSTPDGGWTFGNDGIVNDQKPMPCSESDSKDAAYVNKVFEFIELNPSMFIADRIYTEGFSQNSMFSAYIGFCHSEKVVGIWQGGSGLALKSQGDITLPGMQSHCSASSFEKYHRQCALREPCKECQYWPIYPCYQPKKPMIECLVDYINDPIASSRNNPETISTTLNMYNALVNEGHDVRMMRFTGNRHKNPDNSQYWQVACWGITKQCSTECENSFVACCKSNSFTSCISESRALKGCTKDCAPTYNMMKQSETPKTVKFSKGIFGDNNTKNNPRPKTSKCAAK